MKNARGSIYLVDDYLRNFLGAGNPFHCDMYSGFGLSKDDQKLHVSSKHTVDIVVNESRKLDKIKLSDPVKPL